MNTSIPTLNESKILVDIENFIISMSYENYTEQAFKDGLMQLIPQFKAINQTHLQYSQSIKTFDCLSKEVEKMLNAQDISAVRYFNPVQMACLLELLYYGKLNFALEIIGLKAQEQRNQRSLREYLQKLTQHYAKLLFIRIDLSIELKHHHAVDIEQFNAYLRTFINRVQNQDTCFRGLQGYAWALEQGATKGYHCHVLLIYDGHKHQKDFGMAIQVGQCWSEITANKGYYFISNSTDYKQKFENKGKLGIGMIHRAQPQQVKNAIEAAMYLVNPEKDNQHLRARIKDMRSFGKGQYKINKRRNVKVE